MVQSSEWKIRIENGWFGGTAYFKKPPNSDLSPTFGTLHQLLLPEAQREAEKEREKLEARWSLKGWENQWKHHWNIIGTSENMENGLLSLNGLVVS